MIPKAPGPSPQVRWLDPLAPTMTITIFETEEAARRCRGYSFQGRHTAESATGQLSSVRGRRKDQRRTDGPSVVQAGQRSQDPPALWSFGY